MGLFDHHHDHKENYGLKKTDIPIPSNLFIFDTRWFEKVGIVRSNAWSADNNNTDSDVSPASEINGEDSRRPDHLTDDTALVLAPPRNILKALEDKMALEQSGQFVVGANLDIDIPDFMRDPLRFYPYDAEIEKESSMRPSSLFHRDTFSKISSAFLEGTRKRQVHLFKSGDDKEEQGSQKDDTAHKNNKASVKDGLITLLQFMWQCIGEYERFMQSHNLLPPYKYTILRHQSSREKNFEQEDLLKFHSVDGFEEGSYFEGSGEPCDSKDMELKHQRCVVRAPTF